MSVEPTVAGEGLLLSHGVVLSDCQVNVQNQIDIKKIGFNRITHFNKKYI